MMEEIGNRKSQQIHEAALPENFTRPQTNYAIEEFIRAKYQHKRYCIDPPNTVAGPQSLPEAPKDRSTAPTNRNQSIDISVAESRKRDSDDSLSDPEYLIELKEKPKKPCHKVHSDGDLISFHGREYRLAALWNRLLTPCRLGRDDGHGRQRRDGH